MNPLPDPTSHGADRLLQRLRQDLAEPDLRYVRAPARAPGARFTPILDFDIAPPPPGTTGHLIARQVRSTEQARLEVALHDALSHQNGQISAPAVVLTEADPAILGTPFFVMERIDHQAVLTGVTPARFALAFPRLLRRWPSDVASIARGLAAVDTDSVIAHLESSGCEDIRPGRHLRRVTSILDGVAGFESILEWMTDHQPTISHPVLSHGDLWPTNVFKDIHDATLIDWNRGGIDDPALDIGFAAAGFALMPHPFPPARPLATLAHAAGQHMATKITEHCAELAGGLQRVRYYQALRCLLEIADALDDTAPTGWPRPAWSNSLTPLAEHAQAITGVEAPTQL